MNCFFVNANKLWVLNENFACIENLTDSIGNDPSMSLNSSLSSSVDNFDKWKSLMFSGISVNSPKSLRISGPQLSSHLIESSIGVSPLSLQTAVGSTLGGNHWSKENLGAHPNSSKSRTRSSLPLSTQSCRIVPTPLFWGLVVLTWSGEDERMLGLILPTISTGREVSILWISSFDSSALSLFTSSCNWMSFTWSGISMNSARRCSLSKHSQLSSTISNGVSWFTSETAVGSTLQW